YYERRLGSPFPLPWLRTPADPRVSFESAGLAPVKRQWGCAGNNSHSICENSRAPGLRRAFTAVRVARRSLATYEVIRQSIACLSIVARTDGARAGWARPGIQCLRSRSLEGTPSR